MNSKPIAIIPARGGSKRLKRKNCLALHGKPLIAWTINAALESNIFSKVYVTTEDSEIASIAKTFGADLLTRPPQLADDDSRVDEVCMYHLTHDLSDLVRDSIFFCLYPTAPLRNAIDLKNIYTLLESQPEADGAFAVTQFSHYPFQALSLDNDGYLLPYWKDHILKKGSDFPSFYAGNGSTYAVSISSFLKHGNFSPSNYNILPYFMSQICSIDVDTLDDFQLLEKISTVVNGSLSIL